MNLRRYWLMTVEPCYDHSSHAFENIMSRVIVGTTMNKKDNLKTLVVNQLIPILSSCLSLARKEI